MTGERHAMVRTRIGLQRVALPARCPHGHDALRVVWIGQAESRPSEVIACHACGVTASYAACCALGFWRFEGDRRIYHSVRCRMDNRTLRRRQNRMGPIAFGIREIVRAAWPSA